MTRGGPLVSDNDGRQKVRHFLYEGEVHVWEEDLENDAQLYIHLVDGPHDHGDDLGSHLLWLLGPGRASNPATGQVRLAKRLRILVEDLEPDPAVAERREVDGDPLNLELASLIKASSDGHRRGRPEILARMRDQWQAQYGRAMDMLRSTFLTAAAYELFAAQAERRAEEDPS